MKCVYPEKKNVIEFIRQEVSKIFLKIIFIEKNQSALKVTKVKHLMWQR